MIVDNFFERNLTHVSATSDCAGAALLNFHALDDRDVLVLTGYVRILPFSVDALKRFLSSPH